MENKKQYGFYDRCEENYTGPVKYLVESYGGEYEDSWESPLSIFDSEEDAATFVNEQIENSIKKTKRMIPCDEYNDLALEAENAYFKSKFGDVDYDKISSEEYDKFYDEYEEHEAEHIHEYCKSIGKDYSVELIKESDNFWNYENSYFYKTNGYSVYKIPYSPAK